MPEGRDEADALKGNIAIMFLCDSRALPEARTVPIVAAGTAQ